jgi:hypothetical protein
MIVDRGMNMRSKNVLLVAGLMMMVLGTAGTALSQAAPAKNLHPVRVRYDVPADPQLVPYQKMVQNGHLLEQMAETLNGSFRLPRDLDLTALQCGQVNAFYDPSIHAVKICYEYARSFWNLQSADQRGEDGKIDNAAVIKAVLGTLKFTLHHEVGHALVDILDLPITGGEEDAVDQLAAVVMLSSDDDNDVEAVLDAAYTKLLRAQQTAANMEKMTEAQRKWAEDNPITADEHSLDEQRFYNTTCLAYGSDPQTFGVLVSEGVIPKGRAARCPFEWKRISRSWVRLLAPFAIK